MAGKAGRSGPPGNVNHVRHPWRSFWRRKALEASHRWIIPTLEQYVSELESEKADLTCAEKRVIEIGQISRGCVMLILAECADKGLMRKLEDGSWDLAAGGKELARYLSVELQALKTLGLERRAKPINGGSVIEQIHSLHEAEQAQA